jgi:hypothetical protein
MFLHHAVQRSPLWTAAFVVNRGSIGSPLRLPCNGWHALFAFGSRDFMVRYDNTRLNRRWCRLLWRALPQGSYSDSAVLLICNDTPFQKRMPTDSRRAQTKLPKDAQRSDALILASVPAPGHNCDSSIAFSGPAAVPSAACMSRASRSTYSRPVAISPLA